VFHRPALGPLGLQFKNWGPDMYTKSVLFTAIAAVCFIPATSAHAQVVREAGVKSIAGVLSSPDQPASWTFRSAGGEILFATLDGEIYRTMGTHEAEVTTAADTGGCGSGEDEGGPGRFYLEVQDAAGLRVCYAERPAPPPGWMRDPRMACMLPATGGMPATYRLLVGLKATDHEEPAVATDGTKAFPFILNVSLRRAAPAGTNIQSAIAQSTNGL
jgi:hypothetical protein